MSKTNEKFKKLSLFLCFILIFDFLVLNFGIKPKEAKAAIIGISATRVIDYDLRVQDNRLVFDFSNYLSGDEKIESFVLKDGNTTIDTVAINENKKAWRVEPHVFIEGNNYVINAVANIGGQQKKLAYQFFYHDYELKYRPIMEFDSNNKLKITFKKEFLDLFNEEDSVRLQTYHAPLNSTVKIKDLRSAKVFDKVSRSNFGNNGGDAFTVTIGNNVYKWKLFTVNKNSRIEFNLIDFEVKSGKIKNGFNTEIEAVIKNNDVTLKSGDRIDIQGVQTNIKNLGEKTFTFAREMFVNYDYNATLTPTNGGMRQGIISSCVTRRIQKLNFSSTMVDLQDSVDINVDLSNMFGFLSKTDSKNKITIYELTDDFTKGTKFGEKTSGVIRGINSINIGTKKFNKNKGYIVELTNGTSTIYSSFVYTPMDIVVPSGDIKETSAKIKWTKPTGYTAASGHKIDIFLRDKQGNNNYSSIANKSFTHGGNINLNTLDSAIITGIAPGTNYEVKVVLNNQNGSIVSYGEFTTKPFVLTKPIEIKDSIYNNSEWKIALPRSRKVTVEWDFDPNTIEFSPNDKVEIWVKPNTSSDFSGYPKNKYNNPLFTKTGDLSSTKSADITIPTWLSNFHVDLIYTIGGKEIITRKPNNEEGEVAYNRRTVNAQVNKPDLNITEITQTSAKVVWSYDKDGPTEKSKKYKPEDGHIVKINLKKIPSKNDYTVDGFTEDNKVFYKVHGTDGDILNFTDFRLENLEVGQWYRVRLQHILHHERDNDGQYILVQEFYNFKTEDFSILGLNAEQQSTEDSRNIKLTWRTSGIPDFGDGGEEQNIKVYLKEGNTSEYPKEPLSGVQISGSELKECIINLPKYNTPYTAMIEYNLRGKKVQEHVLVQADGDISINISNISTTGATIICNLPKGYKKKDIDKVKLTVSKELETFGNLPNDENIDISNTSAIKQISNINENDICNVIAKFENDGEVVDIAYGSFKATDKFQIIDFNVSDIKSTTAKLSWNFLPSQKLDSATTGDKIEIYLKRNIKGKEVDPDDELSEFVKIYTVNQPGGSYISDISNQRSKDNIHSQHQVKTQEIKDFKSLDLTKLKVNEEYIVKLKYESTALSSDGEGVKESEISFKTIADTFKATVFTSNQTTATYGWEYPPGYDIQDGDKVDIYITEIDENGDALLQQPDGLGDTTPLLTLEHGSEEDGKYDLNKVTRVDVSGLTPERNYKSKIEFTMGKGEDAPKISTEVKISTKSFKIKSFTVDSYQEYDILVKWEIEPENMMFNPADKLEIFVKVVEGEDEKIDEEITQKPSGYPENPAYLLTTTPTDEEEKTISNTFSDYVLAESLGVKQKMLLVYTVGDKKYYKELEFINTINPVKAEVTSVDETRALISITAPDNYEFVEGDKLLVYAKDEFAEDAEIESEDFLVFEGVQSETLSIPDDMKMIELSYLLPEAKYEILVALDLEDGTVEPAKLELTTTALPVSDIKLESLKHDSAIISWNYGENEIDFFKDENSYDFTDKLIIVHKEADGTAIPDDITAIKKLSHVEYLGEDIRGIKDATIKVEDTSKDYDVAVCYDLGGLLYKKNFKASYLSVKIDEESLTDKGVKINWKYPSNITFGDGDKTEVFIRKKDEANYPEAAAFSSTGSGTVSYTFENLEGGVAYIAKVQITKEGLQIDPVEVEFETKSGLAEETVIEEIQQEIVGTEVQVTIPGLENLEVKKDELQVSMGDEAYKDFTVRLTEDGTGVIIEPTIPKKVYKNIEVTIPLEDGTVRKIVIAEFVTQPENVGQDWLSNAYKFALDRFPDEGGYKYWYEERIQKKTMSGEYFLMNLLFGEDEFTNRNLGDKDLIAALYQIVVNREYDEEGLNFWIGIYNENLGNAQGNKKLAQEVLVDRMVHEAEFGKLCEKIGIFWTKKDQEAAGVPM